MPRKIIVDYVEKKYHSIVYIVLNAGDKSQILSRDLSL